MTSVTVLSKRGRSTFEASGRTLIRSCFVTALVLVAILSNRNLSFLETDKIDSSQMLRTQVKLAYLIHMMEKVRN